MALVLLASPATQLAMCNRSGRNGCAKNVQLLPVYGRKGTPVRSGPSLEAGTPSPLCLGEALVIFRLGPISRNHDPTTVGPVLTLSGRSRGREFVLDLIGLDGAALRDNVPVPVAGRERLRRKHSSADKRSLRVAIGTGHAARSEQGDLVTDTRADFSRAAWLVLARLERTT